MTVHPRTIAVRSRPEQRSRLHAAYGGILAGARMLAVVGLLGFAGCYSPMYSQPYGQPYAQPYGQPVYPGTTAPGGMYTPGVSPGAPSGSPTFDSTNPIPDPSGGNAPYFGSPSSSTQNRQVPEYNDTYYNNSSGAANPFDSTADPNTENWEAPLTGTGTDREISMSREVRNFSGGQYAYDANGHRWLQGVVSFDPRDKSWGIVYNDNPPTSDPYSGYLTLVDDPRLKSLKDGDVVRLEGEVDSTQLDFSDRPSYRMQQMKVISR